jgi:protein-disulfide isomerase-like protein with CxxC motif
MPDVKLILRISLIFSLSALIAFQAAAQSKLIVEDVEIHGYRTVLLEETKKRIQIKQGWPFSRISSTGR